MSQAPAPADKPKLSDAEIDELREAFSTFDKDGSGSITADELGEMFKSLMPASFSKLKNDDLTKIVAKFDKNKDGTIDFDEFLDMMMSHTRQDQDEMVSAFRIFDKDGDGTISAKEIMTVMKALGEDVDEETCNLMVKSVDLDGNGTIDVYEFKKMMRDGFAIGENEAKRQ